MKLNITSALERDEDINKLDSNGDSLLYKAVKKRYLKIVNYLLDNAADTEQVNANGNTPLILAVEYNHLDIVTSLLKHGANVNHALGNGGTPLFMAAQNRAIAIVKLLLTVEAIDHTATFHTTQQLLTNFTSKRSCKTQQRMKEFIAKQEDPDDIRMRADEMAAVMRCQKIVDLIQQHECVCQSKKCRAGI